jgi:hypothetical protein
MAAGGDMIGCGGRNVFCAAKNQIASFRQYPPQLVSTGLKI